MSANRSDPHFSKLWVTGIPGCLLLWGPLWETAGLQWVPSSHFPFISYIDHHPQRDDRNPGTDINSTIQNKFVHPPRALSNTVQKIKERPGQLHPSFLSDLFLPSLSELLTMFYIIFQDKHPRQKKSFFMNIFIGLNRSRPPDSVEPRAPGRWAGLFPSLSGLQPGGTRLSCLSALYADNTARSFPSRSNLWHFIFQERL